MCTSVMSDWVMASEQSMMHPRGPGAAMRTAFTHMERSLRLHGLLPHWPVRRQPRSVALAVLHALVWSATWGYVGMRFTSYKYGVARRGAVPHGVALAILAMIHSLFVQTALTVLVSLRFAQQRKHIYKTWGSYRQANVPHWARQLSTRVLRLTAGIWLIIVTTQILVVGYYIFGTDEFTRFSEQWVIYSVFREVPSPPLSYVIVTFHHILQGYLTICIVHITLALFLFIIYELTIDFTQLNKEFSKQLIEASRADFPQVFHSFHIRHQTLCELVTRVDDVFSIMVLAFFCCGITIICLILFISVTYPPYSHLTLPTTAHFVLLMIILACMGARLSDAVSMQHLSLFWWPFNRRNCHRFIIPF